MNSLDLHIWEVIKEMQPGETVAETRQRMLDEQAATPIWTQKWLEYKQQLALLSQVTEVEANKIKAQQAAGMPPPPPAGMSPIMMLAIGAVIYFVVMK